MRAGNERSVDEADHATDSTEMSDLVDWEASSHTGSAEHSGGRDHTVRLAVAGIVVAALLVGGLVVYVLSRAH